MNNFNLFFYAWKMKLRKCFRCGKDLVYEDYIKNYNSNEWERLTIIWNCKYIELFCCNCYCFKTKYQPNIDQELKKNYLKSN